MELYQVLILSILTASAFALISILNFSNIRKVFKSHLWIHLILGSSLLGHVTISLSRKTPKLFFADIIILIATIYYFLNHAFFKKNLQSSFSYMEKNLVLFLFSYTIYLLFCIVSLYMSLDISRSIVPIIEIIKNVLFFIFAYSLLYKDRDSIFSVIRFFPLIGLAISIITILYSIFYFHIDPLDLFDWGKSYIFKNKVASPLGRNNTIGGILALLLPVSFASAVLFRRSLRFLIYIAIGITTIGLITTSSHGAVLSILLGYLVFYLLFAPIKDKALFVLSILLTFLGLYLFSDLLIINSIHHSQLSLIGRFRLFEDSFSLIRSSFLIGIGKGMTFNYLSIENSHNIFFSVLMEAGFFAALFFLLSYICIVKKAIRSYLHFAKTTDYELTILSRGILISLITAFINSQLEPLMETPIYDVFLFCLIALLYSMLISSPKSHHNVFRHSLTGMDNSSGIYA